MGVLVVDLKLGVVVPPVSDADRTKEFYKPPALTSS
jgi:hypothetical protein